ncbi:MAG: transporter [Bacteroidota bacterium]
MMKIKPIKVYFLLFVCCCTYSLAIAQGDGPRTYLLAPKGVTGINIKWLNLDQNITPPNIFTPGASIQVNVYPVTLFHTFAIKGVYTQAYFMVNPGSVTATATNVSPVLPIPDGFKLSADGLSDGFAGLRVGLKGTPGMSVSTFLEEKMRFSMFADVRYWYSGTYDSKKLLNLGSNRSTLQFSFPMAIPLNKKRERATWLELSPAVEFFADNTDPSRGNNAQTISQTPLYMLESHLSHNFNKKFWSSVSLRYRQGGETEADGKPDDNEMRILGATVGLGYQVLPFLGLNADYGQILYGYNDAESNMLRVSMVVSYANMKKK